MTTISIIGSGNMATAIGTRAAKHGHTIEVMSRDTAKAQALADKISNAVTRPPGGGGRPLLPADHRGLRAGEGGGDRIIDSVGYGVVDAGPLADSWRQATGTPVWGTPYGTDANEKGQPAGEDAIRTALATATR
jgi:predicted dinucleotide-binding enzyme